MANRIYSSLEHNATYYGPHGDCTYHTDQYGRVAEWSGRSVDEKEDRNPYAQRSLEGKSEEFRDASHLMGRTHGGSGEKYNLIPQDSALNQRDYKAFENENEQLRNAGYTVTLHGYNSFLFEKEGINVPDGIMVTRDLSDKDNNTVDTSHHSWSNYNAAAYENAGEKEASALMDEFENPDAFIFNEDENIAMNNTTGEIVDVSERSDSVEETIESNDLECGNEDLSDDDSLAL